MTYAKRILFHCDNQAIVQVWQTGLSRSTAAAFHAGVPEFKIQTLRRWRSSNYKTYILTSPESLHKATKHMADRSWTYHGHQSLVIHCLFHTPCSYITFDKHYQPSYYCILSSQCTSCCIYVKGTFNRKYAVLQNLGKFGGEIKSVPGLYASPWPCSSDAQHAV